MKSFTIASAFLAAAAVAQPHGNPHGNHHRRHHQNDKRGVVTEVEWVTEYEYVTKLVDATTTLWVTPEDKPTAAPEAETKAPEAPKAPKKEKKPAAPTTTLVTSVYTPPPAPESTTEAEAEAAPEPTSEYVAPVEPTTQAPAPKPVTTQAPAPKAKPAAKPKPVEQPEPETETETETPAIAPVQQEKAASGGSSGGSSAAKKGEFTYYDIGVGACGGPSAAGQDESVSIVALSHLLMGEKSNDNPMCGKTITIKANGKTTTAVVKDKCMGCEINDIDVSRKVFKEIWGSTDKGRTPVEWWFN